MTDNFIYPEINEKLQSKIYRKREYYSNKIPENKELKTYEEIKDYRDKECGGDLKLYTHQNFLKNFINPYTPFKGLLLFHGVGTGKTASAISIAENFKELVLKYDTKVYVLVPGPLLKENFKDDIIKFTGNNYLKEISTKLGYLDDREEIKAKSMALRNAMEHYIILSHRGFYKRVLGDKIKITKEFESEKKDKYRRNEEGEIERDLSINKIDNLNNTVLIIDEAHNFTNNEHGDALKLLIKKSKNLRLILLSATPMKNLGDDIIELINYLRPLNDQIKREKVFNSHKNYLMDFKPGGEEYLMKMCNGYVSHYRGSNPLLFAKKNFMGEIPPSLIFTYCTRCKMNKFQNDTYQIVSSNIEDTLERRTSSVANIVFPVLNNDKNKIIGGFGENGINIIKSNLKSNKSIYLKLINKKFFNNKVKDLNDIIYQSNITGNITGLIYKKENLKQFSTKFHKLLENLSNLVKGKNGSKTVFIYSNLVKVGIEVIQEILLQNGYLEFNEERKYNITDNTIDYLTGKKYSEFTNKKEFYPATFIKITGKSDDETDTAEIKKKLLDKYFNNINNVQGKYLKVILGSKVMNEGITLENTGEVHIMDAYYTLGRIEQVIGRAVRQCKHYSITSKKNPYPDVKIYKYVVSVDKGLSSEEKLYKKAELKYILIKKVERILKRSAVDCPINYSGNVFKNEYLANKNCYKPEIGKKIPKGKKICSVGCDFMECDFKCYDKSLNLKYYNKNSLMYKKIDKSKLDYSTFNEFLAKNEIKEVKEKIKVLFKTKYIYTLDEIVDKIKSSYKNEQYELFENFFIYQALDQLLPTTENDFNNYTDGLSDKYNIPGYLIYRDKYYIFQPFNQNEEAPIFYRKNFNKKINKKIPLMNYLKNKNIKFNKESNEKIKKNEYNFNKNKFYYDNKKEFVLVGIIDKDKNGKEVFKIREKKTIISNKKRGTGILSDKGAVCHTSKDKEELLKYAKLLKIKKVDRTRVKICKQIKEKLLELEINAKGKNKLVYIITPYDHPKYIWPINIEDRILHIQKEFNKNQKSNIKIKYSKNKLEFKYDKKILVETQKLLDRYKIIKKGNNFSAKLI